MKDNTMTENAWRTVQMFLSTQGVFEVEVNTDSHAVRCNCSNFRIRNTCAHEKHVNSKSKDNGGTYPVKLSPRATEEEAEKAQESPEAFRSFIVKYGKVEVL